jgi:hypothetical protein
MLFSVFIKIIPLLDFLKLTDGSGNQTGGKNPYVKPTRQSGCPDTTQDLDSFKDLFFIFDVCIHELPVQPAVEVIDVSLTTGAVDHLVRQFCGFATLGTEFWVHQKQSSSLTLVFFGEILQ